MMASDLEQTLDASMEETLATAYRSLTEVRSLKINVRHYRPAVRAMTLLRYMKPVHGLPDPDAYVH